MPDEITDVQVDGAPIQPDTAEGVTAPTPDKTYTQVEYDTLKQSLTDEFKTKSDETFRKRWGKETAKFEEETGLNRNFLKTFKPLAQQYGVTPQYLVETILNQLKQTPEGTSPSQVTLPPEIQEMLEERKAEKEQKSLDEVKSLYKKDFSAEIDEDDLETVREIAEEEKIPLKAAYYMAVRERWSDQLSKSKETQVLKNLADKKKGSVVPGTAPKVTSTKQYGSIREGLSAIADEIGLT